MPHGMFEFYIYRRILYLVASFHRENFPGVAGCCGTEREAGGAHRVPEVGVSQVIAAAAEGQLLPLAVTGRGAGEASMPRRWRLAPEEPSGQARSSGSFDVSGRGMGEREARRR